MLHCRAGVQNSSPAKLGADSQTLVDLCLPVGSTKHKVGGPEAHIDTLKALVTGSPGWSDLLLRRRSFSERAKPNELAG